ncbi:SLC35G1 [Cordylochernes scorpioides]|uniref:SLC35G1 n=1 Tax=Cordylochernes scorpioides TaxID=51811 RepID=A0ABY6L7Z7_9ARAC|nr:SLC35G1 [Cordylochernes scorpioides]
MGHHDPNAAYVGLNLPPGLTGSLTSNRTVPPSMSISIVSLVAFTPFDFVKEQPSMKELIEHPAVPASSTPPSSQSSSLLKGLCYMSASTTFLSLSLLSVKILLRDLNAGEIATIRYLTVLVYNFPALIYSREPIFGPPGSRALLIIGGLIDGVSLCLYLYAFENLSFSTASVVVFTLPAVVSLLARIFLKEPFGIFHVMNLTCLALGIAIISDIPFEMKSAFKIDKKFLGMTSGILSTFFAAIQLILMRKLIEVHHTVITFNFHLAGIVECGLLTYSFYDPTPPTCGLEVGLLWIMGILFFLSNWFLLKAIKSYNVGPISLLRVVVSIVQAFLLQVLFFKEYPTKRTIVGTLVIMTSVTFIDQNSAFLWKKIPRLFTKKK